MPDNKDRYYWDSCVFLAVLSNRDDPLSAQRRAICSQIVARALNQEVEIVTSTITLAEVLRDGQQLPGQPVPDDVKERIRQFFDQEFITLVSADFARSQEARDLRYKYGWLQTPDAIHIGSACYAKVDELHTYDGAGKPKGLINLSGLECDPPLKIVEPTMPPGQPPYPA